MAGTFFDPIYRAHFADFEYFNYACFGEMDTYGLLLKRTLPVLLAVKKSLEYWLNTSEYKGPNHCGTFFRCASDIFLELYRI